MVRQSTAAHWCYGCIELPQFKEYEAKHQNTDGQENTCNI